MSQRVLSTEAARSAIQRMQAILSGELEAQVTQLKRQGDILADPNVWDGPYASQFRGSIWAETSHALDRTVKALDDLRTAVQRVNENIMSAGGGG